MPKYQYTGDGSEYLEGVPARDLEDDDVAQLDDQQRAAVETSPLYQTPDQPKGKKAAADAATPDAPKPDDPNVGGAH